MTDISGPTSQLPFAFYDPDMSCLRTCAVTLLSDSTEFSVILPVSGSMRSGRLFQQPRLVPVIDGNGSSLLLPTPTCTDARDGRYVRQMTVDAMKRSARRGINLNHMWENDQVREFLLPTPVVNDMGAGKTVQQWDEWTARMQASHANGNGHGPSLSIETLRLLPTPVANRGGQPSETRQGGDDLQTAVTLVNQSLANTAQQLADGLVPLDDPHPNPPAAGGSTPSSSSG